MSLLRADLLVPAVLYKLAKSSAKIIGVKPICKQKRRQFLE